VYITNYKNHNSENCDFVKFRQTSKTKNILRKKKMVKNIKGYYISTEE